MVVTQTPRMFPCVTSKIGSVSWGYALGIPQESSWWGHRTQIHIPLEGSSIEKSCKLKFPEAIAAEGRFHPARMVDKYKGLQLHLMPAWMLECKEAPAEWVAKLNVLGRHAKGILHGEYKRVHDLEDGQNLASRLGILLYWAITGALD